ncbi:MAG TPA: PD-(D/E)XK nuclease family protein [Gammaproteobacteria bacterium]|nr:PD-(D/E)XK nuclease family protein [Gammaproteobacteria bacterium]
MTFSLLLEALDEGACVITANQRLAWRLRLAAAARRAASSVFERPAIWPWSAWLTALHEEALLTEGNGPRLFSAAQSVALWTRVIGAAPEAGVLLQPAATARAAFEAWQLTHAWHLAAVAADDDDAHPDHRAFARWYTEYERYLRAHDALDTATLPDWLRSRVAALVSAPRIVLAGFLQLTPQQRDFCKALGGAGIRVEMAPTATVRAQAVRAAPPHPAAELVWAARWARARHEADPRARVAVVVHDLEARRAQVFATFDAVFDPLRHDPAAGDRPRPYNVSLGEPLAQAPVVAEALTALALADTHVDWPALSRLLLAPSVGGAGAERGVRARVEVALRARVAQRVAVTRALELASAARVWVERVTAMRERLRTPPARRTPSAWGALVLEALAALGWPAERANQADRDATGAFRSLIGRLGELDAIEGELEFAAFRALLARLAGEELHQPRTPELPVEVLGTFEALGQSFDHLWIAGWHDANWPPAPRPNPFLPAQRQREAGIPLASAAGCQAHARAVYDALAAAARELVVSTPCVAEDTPLRPSALVMELPCVTEEALALAPHPDLVRRLFATHALEPVLDDKAPPLAAAATGGGTDAIKRYAACPFQAFAVHRLHAEDLEEPPIAPDARERGMLMHDALRQLWDALQSHAGLVALDAAARKQHVAAAVESALDRARRRRPGLYSPRFATLERERLNRRLLEWLDIEARRAPFRVLEQEEERELQLGPLILRLRADRRDELADGSLAIVDYKTGEVRHSDWLGERPDDPQLPLYALSEPRTAALLFARLKAGQLCFEGYAREPERFVASGEQGVTVPPAGWEEQLAAWRTVLTALAVRYAAGETPVAPKCSPNGTPVACRHCRLASLCRVAELDVTAQENGDD